MISNRSRAIYLHIGLVKTGTTFLQIEVFPKLKKVNYVCLDDNDSYQRQIFKKILDQESLLFEVNRTKDDLLRHFDPNKDNLLSIEMLSGSPNIQYRDRLNILEKLYALFPDAKIIVGIRSQSEMISSVYNQYVAMGGTKSIKKFIYSWGNDYERPYCDSLDLDTFKYSYYLKAIQDRFGKRNMYIYLYEDMQNDINAFIKGMLGFLGETEEISFKNTRHNPSFGILQIRLCRVLNFFFESKHNPAGFLPRVCDLPFIGKMTPATVIKRLKCLGAKKSVDLPRNQPFDRLKEYYFEDNKFIDKYYGLDLKKKHGSVYY